MSARAAARRHTRRDTNEREIIDALRKAGCQVWQLDQPCDLVVTKNKTTYMMEVKETKGKLSPDQIKFFAEWSGGHLHVVRSIEQAIYVINHAIEVSNGH